MATTQKKTTAAGKSGQSRSGSSAKAGNQTSRRASSSSSGSPGKSRRKTPKKSYAGRTAAAVVLFLLALFMILGMFGIQAVVIDWLSAAVKGLLGYGFWVTAPMFLVAAYLLAFRHTTSALLRAWCALLLPVTAGSFLHLLLSPVSYALSLGTVTTLWPDGIALKSGGAVSGIIAVAFATWFSKIGTYIILFLAMLLLLFAALNITPASIVDAVHRAKERRDDYDEYEEDEEYEEETKPTSHGAQSRAVRQQTVDIPLDGDASSQQEPGAKPVRKNSFFNRISKVKRPDEILTHWPEKPAEQPENQEVPEEREPAFVPEPIAVETPEDANPVELKRTSPMAHPEPIVSNPVEEPAAFAAPVPEITREPAVKRETANPKEEVRQKAQEVAMDIESNLDAQQAAYQYPTLSLLHELDGAGAGEIVGELRVNQGRLDETIRSFGIDAKIANVVRGPSVTRYEVELEQGVRLNKLTNLADDIALALGAVSVRIAPVPGKISMVGIEVPNQAVTPVGIREVLSSEAFLRRDSKVSFAVGKDIGGKYIIGDVAQLPHLLIAGTTGSGKSVCTNSLIVSLLYKASPEDVRLIMVDPKMVELGVYNGIPHLLIPVVTDPKKAAGALQWAVTEMMKRYRSFSEAKVRKLEEYNAQAAKTEGMEPMPQVVVVIDELADLMLAAAKEVEDSICRVAQMGRAAGIHLIIATQRPSADVITGLMKANIPSRIAFAVASSLESRIILDQTGAEKLVGKGDMLWFPLGAGKPTRVQGCLISDDEIHAVVNFVKSAGTASYDERVIQEIEQHVEEREKGGKGSSAPALDNSEDYDEQLPAAVDIVMDLGQASVSMLQRRLKLGYSRAARLVDQMEEQGIVGPFEGSKPRQVLITKEQWQAMKGQSDRESPRQMDLFQGDEPPVEPPAEMPPWEEEDEP